MQIKILDVEYELVDVLNSIAIADSAVCGKHKIGTANGERKIYLSGNVKEKNEFFDKFSNIIDGFLLKSNLIEYLEMAKSEYEHPTQEYLSKKEMKDEYEIMIQFLKGQEEVLRFKVKNSDVTHSGFYINQDSGNRSDKNWNLMGDIALPRISRLSILKLRDENTTQYYFKVGIGSTEIDEDEVNRQEEASIHEIKNSDMTDTEKETVILSRVGQGKYRKNLLDETNMCPFTLVNDEHLLIASHIKPWRDSTNIERKDHKNGFIFTPTYDKLFDNGYISFYDNKELIISPWLSKYNKDMLNLKDGMIMEHLPIDDKRNTYLEYHRKNVLKKLEDL